MLVFKGIQKTTLIDFPGRVACTLFLPKCNFRCPFCYNEKLVLDKDTGVKISEKEVLQFLAERKGFLDGVCITGGEPLLHSGLLSFCKKLKEAGLFVKLDTNGSKPKMLGKLLAKKAVDYIAMDIKNSPQKYEKAAGVKVDLQAIEESVKLIRKSGLHYEFRTTVIPSLHSEPDILQIGKWLKGSNLFALQQFNSSVRVLDHSLEGSRPYSREKLQHFAEILKPFFHEVKLRGI